MTCLEWVILILAFGLVSMIEVCVISITVGRVVESKMKTKSLIEYKIFKQEMKEIASFVKQCMGMYLSNENKKEVDTKTSRVVQPKRKPVAKTEDCAKEDPDLDELEDDLDDWLK